MKNNTSRIADIAVIGAGPAGLMAAQSAADTGASVVVFDAMPTPGRKFLMAGRSGLNLTHAEDFSRFMSRYGVAGDWLAPMITAFSPDDIRAFCANLGQETFIGTSGRIFPRKMKASPLLRAWLARLSSQNVTFHLRQKFLGFDEAGGLQMVRTDGSTHTIRAGATVLALGGASWPRLGSDGSWTPALKERGIAVTPLTPANSGLLLRWSEMFRQRFEGVPIKNAAFTFEGTVVKGEALITKHGLEGSPLYALSSAIAAAAREGRPALITTDLRPDLDFVTLCKKLDKRRPADTIANGLRKTLGLSPVAIALMRESSGILPADSPALAQCVKASVFPLTGIAGLERAISSAGGVARTDADASLMLHHLPGIFVAGEMLDWDAPTGGYLLQACFSTGYCAGRAAARWTGKS